MEQERHFWVLDERVLEYVKFSQFHWIELLVMAVGLSLLASYAVLAWYLDRRARARRRRQRQLQRLETWLAAWQLAPDEEDALRELAGDDRPLSLYALLADPVRFETAVHEALQRGARLPFVDRVREALGYQSGNLQTPIASTRQLVPGDHFRFSVWEEGRPQHHYGIVTAVSPGGVSVELTESGYKAVRGKGGEVDLFYLRGNDVEYRFPLVVRSAEEARHRLLLAHELVRGGHRPRSTRLPMLRPIVFRLHTQLPENPREEEGVPPAPPAEQSESTEGGGAAEAARPGREQRAALLEMSEGGFSMVALKPVAEGAYVEYDMPLPRGRSLPIMGRVLDCRSFAGNRWLVRCELRGLKPTQRNTLAQALRLEQQRRLRAMQADRRKRRREATREP